MAISGISAPSIDSSASAAQQTLQPLTHRKHGHHSASLSDVDAQGSSLASAPSASGKTGSKIDVTA